MGNVAEVSEIYAVPINVGNCGEMIAFRTTRAFSTSGVI
jgi:hypothetical protein